MDPGVGLFGVEARRSRAAAAAFATAVVASVVAGARPALEAAGVDGDLGWVNRAATLLGLAAVLGGLAGLYIAATRGIGGRGVAKAALGLGAAAALYAFFDAAVRDGTLMPDRFVDQYFDWEIVSSLRSDLWHGAVNTVRLAFVAEAFAIAAGLVVATFALSSRWWFHFPAVAYVDVVRGLPLVMLTLLIHFGLPNIGITLGDFVSPVVILTINASAYVAEIFRAGIQALPRGQMDAARSLGMPHGTAMTTVVIPQAARAVIPPLMSEFIALVKDTAIVIAIIGFTTATRDLYGAATQAASSTFSPTPYMAAAIVYLIITVPLARIVGRLERRVRVRLA